MISGIGTTNIGTHPPIAPPSGRLDQADIHRHSVQFYGDDAFLLDELSQFIGSALGAGGVGIVVASKEHRDRLAQQLRRRGIDVTLATKQGRYVSLDAAKLLTKFMVNGMPDAARFAEVIGNVVTSTTQASQSKAAPVAIFGEMVQLLYADGNTEASIWLEQLWNDLAQSHNFDLRCAYSMDQFNQANHEESLSRICAAHSHVIPTESYMLLADDEERLRAIALLQQKAQSLETEIQSRKSMQETLERRETELADFLENAVEGVQQVGADQVVMWANKALLNLLGYGVDEYVGHRLSEFYADPEVFETFWQRLMDKEDIRDYAAELKCKDGSVKHVLVQSNGLWEDERFVHTRCFIRDMTEQKLIEQRKDDFMALIAHELKTPLTAVKGYSQYALRVMSNLGTADDRVVRMLQTVVAKSDFLNELINDMLSVSRMEHDELPLRIEKFDLTRLVEEVVDDARLSEPTFEITYNVENDPVVVNADRQRIEQVISNLVNNAIKYSGDSRKIEIAVSTKDNEVVTLVRDYGMGIPADQQEQLFKRFFRANNVNSLHRSGLGLGLYLAHGIIHRHDGRMWLESREGEGSTFYFTIPTSFAEEDPAHSVE